MCCAKGVGLQSPIYRNIRQKKTNSNESLPGFCDYCNSPDLNPIEHMWALLKRRLNEYDTAPKGMNELFERITDTWYKKITKEDCLKVIDSMPSRIEAVIKSKGYWTEY